LLSSCGKTLFSIDFFCWTSVSDFFTNIYNRSANQAHRF